MNTRKLEKYQGALVGLAVGDVLGMPVEGMSQEEIRERYRCVEKYIDPAADTRAGKLGLKAGQYTDDTQLAIVVAAWYL
jgi:ADP-ribosyl-[dinitrogen reductase] hydrolase